MYQPELESFKGNNLSGRAAVSVTKKGEKEPTFGAIWVTARVDTDRDSRMVSILDVKVDNVRFPEAEPAQEQQLAGIIEQEVPKWELTLSLDRLLTSLDQAEKEKVAAENLGTTPPKIVFLTYPAVLVTIDGEPLMQQVEGSTLQRVVNTPFTIIFSPSAGTYYLSSGDESWYTTSGLKGKWELTSSVPGDVAALKPAEPNQTELEGDSQQPPPGEEDEEAAAPPALIVATEPTELIVTRGEPEYKPIEGTGLLYISNTNSDVVMEIASQQHFIVLSGRWYASRSLEGPWAFVPPDQLPADFAKIPQESDMGHLLLSVPGTQAAKEAVLDQQIPQTSAIDRNAAPLTVDYDGQPKFELIEGTSLQYAVNTSYQVIKDGNKYYLCYEGVWYVATGPYGNYLVADSVPAEIAQIPPTVPVYNVKYVYIYDSTPDVVYVGYTPGYTYSYVYGGTVVYGTGYYYHPWYHTVYYPRPATWGFHVRYNPWTGWSCGFSYTTGRFTFGIGYGGWYRGGWWGPVGYRGYHRGYHRGWHRGYRAGYRAGARTAHRNNIYHRQTNRARNVTRSAARTTTRTGARTETRIQQTSTRRSATATNRSNNVHTDRSGNVYRRSSGGDWQQRSGSSWKSGTGSANRSQLNSAHSSRQRGTARTQSYRGGSRGGRR
jgi:hypothetical protein